MKKTVAVIFGGTNTEHEVSLMSAKAIISNLDKKKYQILPLQITKENQWIIQQEGLPAGRQGRGVNPFDLPNMCDLVFPVLHGKYGEDGTLQGLLEMLHLPYVGCGVTASALCMDKVLQKNVCQSYHLPVVPYFWFTKGEWDENQSSVLTNLSRKFPSSSFPLFVKPANQGSSVGITKVGSKKELIQAIKIALSYDNKVIVEQAVPNVREIECLILGQNHAPESSTIGEIIPHNDFYDYKTKYINDKSEAVIPAKLSPNLAEQIKAMACLAFQVLDCYGLSRVDFLLNSKTNKIYLNELNTMPGFTPISMYPKLWQAAGLSYSALLDRLVKLALIRPNKSLV